ncbi:MAG: RNA-binding transcriptional accessory protein, partial [Duncaniella sp.]|nr:RNA-binding transcriptional accessory protein [Duncaniella sp.]
MVNVHANIITKELGTHLRKHVAACLHLLDEGATVPFIARYRKEATGAMDEVVVRSIQMRHEALAELDKRKEYIKDVIRE